MTEIIQHGMKAHKTIKLFNFHVSDINTEYLFEVINNIVLYVDGNIDKNRISRALDSATTLCWLQIKE
jgi:hypothetical protein